MTDAFVNLMLTIFLSSLIAGVILVVLAFIYLIFWLRGLLERSAVRLMGELMETEDFQAAVLLAQAKLLNEKQEVEQI